MTFSRDRELLHLFIAGTAVSLALIWVFLGQNIIDFLVPKQNQIISYYFFSGIIFTLAAIGIYVFFRTILSFTEFLINTDNLTSLMFENLLDEEYEGIFLKNRSGIYKIINPIAATVLGLEDRQVTGLTDQQLHDASRANKFSHEDQRVINFGETIVWETTKKTKNGIETYMCKKFPCRDHKKNIIAIIGVCKNITIFKTFQHLNQQQDDRYTNLFNKLPYPVLILDSVSLQPLNFNNSMVKLLGYQRDEFSRMRLSLHIEPDALPDFQKSLSRILENSGGEFDTRFVTKQRNIINVAGYAQEITINDRIYLHMLCYDNTETKKSTETLISSELKYRSLFEHANDAIIIVSPNTLNIIDANEIAISTLGYSRDTLFLMSIRDLDANVELKTTSEKIADLEIYNHAIYERFELHCCRGFWSFDHWI